MTILSLENSFINLNTKEFEIFSKGHRNSQGLAVMNNIILSTEHGPRGGDELNRIYYNKNYGWPDSILRSFIQR